MHFVYVFNRNGAKLADFKRYFHMVCKNENHGLTYPQLVRHVFARQDDNERNVALYNRETSRTQDDSDDEKV